MRPAELLEREPLLAALTGHLDEAHSGGGVMTLLGGEAGIGKTMLVRRFCSDVAGRADVLVGACDAMSTPRPLGPLLDMAPSLGEEFAGALGSAERRAGLFDAFLAAIGAGDRPTVVVFEDAHWADDATLDLLRYLGRRLPTRRALAIVTYRDDETGPRHPLRTVIGDLATSIDVRRLTIPGLGLDSVTRLARGSGVDAAALHRTTRGNPFFVTEVLAAGGHGVPASVRDAVAARVARLGDDAREALEAASVVGPQAEVDVVTATGIGVEAIEECVAAGMLEGTLATLAFRHELVRDVVYGALSPARRRALHAAVLRALEALSGRRDDLATLAHHAAQAGVAEAVLRIAPEAGRRASAVGAHREAYAQFARALPFRGALPPRERAELLEAHADECDIADREAEGIASRLEAGALWRELGEEVRWGVNASRLSNLYVGAGDNAAADAASTEALEVLERHGAIRELANATRGHAHLRMLDRDSTAAVRFGARAIDLAAAIDDVAIVAGAQLTVGAALLMAGEPGAREHLDRSVALGTQYGLPRIVVSAHVNLGSGSGELHRFAEAGPALERAIALAEEHDIESQRVYALAWLALTRMYEARWDEAGELALRVAQRTGSSTIARIMALVALGRLRVRRGDPEAWPVLDEALELAQRTGTLQRLAPVRAARAEAASLQDDRDAVREEARSAYDLALRSRHPWFVGELGYWRWSVGDLQALPPYAARPFALQVAGAAVEATEAWEALGCPYEASRALMEARQEAPLRRALAGFEALGARPAAARAVERLREIGARGIPRGPRPSTRRHPASLTVREAEVLSSIARGLRNAEIARHHRVSTRTIDHQVSAVLAKLGVRSRTEAVTEAHRLGLLPHDRQGEAPD